MSAGRRLLLKNLAILALTASVEAHAAADLTFANIAGYTGAQAATGNGLRDGIQLYFDLVNAGGGVKGSRLVLLAVDDEYSPAKTLEAVRKIRENPNVIALLATLGTANNDALVKSGLLEPSGLVNLGPRAAAGVVSASRETYRLRASYAAEIRKIVAHSSVIGATRFALVSQNDALGGEAADALPTALTGGMSLVTSATYDRILVDMTPAVEAMTGSNAQVIVFAGTSKACVAFVRQYRDKGGRAMIYTLSTVDPAIVARELDGEKVRGLITAQTMPSPRNAALPLAREMKAALAKTGSKVELNYTTIEGYVVAKTAVEVLKRSASLDRRGFRAALESRVGKIDLGGLRMDFTDDSHDAGDYVELGVVGLDGKTRN